MDSPNTSADYFADSSLETVTPNEPQEPVQIKLETAATAMQIDEDEIIDAYPPAPVIDSNLEQSLISGDTSLLVNKFISESTLPYRICCPFCIFDFGYAVLLKDHIKQAHERELKVVLCSSPGQVDFHQCPFCEAKFYIQELLPKHIIRKHEMCVVNIFSGFSPEKYVYCRFCPHKMLRKHYKLLMIHIEKKHYSLFEKYIISKYSNITKSYEDIINLNNQDIRQYDIPGPSGKMLKLSTKENLIQSPNIKSILKPKTAYPLDKSECLYTKKENSLYANLTLPKKNSRRKLRFDLPNSPRNQECKENITNKKKKNEKKDKPSKWAFSSKNKKLSNNSENKENQIEEGVSQLPTQICRFKCGLCSESFDINAKLIEHLRKKHKGLKLQAQYRCGECQAKFYRNSYLVKHCWSSHGPLCLKTPIFKKDFSIKF